MKTEHEMIIELHPSKDYDNTLKEQFTYHDMILFSIRMEIQKEKNNLNKAL